MGINIVVSTSALKPKIKGYQITYRIDRQDAEQGTPAALRRVDHAVRRPARRRSAPTFHGRRAYLTLF